MGLIFCSRTFKIYISWFGDFNKWPISKNY